MNLPKVVIFSLFVEGLEGKLVKLQLQMYFQIRIQKDFCSIMAYVRYYGFFFNCFRNSLASFTLLTST